jgi:hypothetical protein
VSKGIGPQASEPPGKVACKSSAWGRLYPRRWPNSIQGSPTPAPHPEQAAERPRESKAGMKRAMICIESPVTFRSPLGNRAAWRES